MGNFVGKLPGVTLYILFNTKRQIFQSHLCELHSVIWNLNWLVVMKRQDMATQVHFFFLLTFPVITFDHILTDNKSSLRDLVKTTSIFGTPLALRVLRVSSESSKGSVFRPLDCLSRRLGATRSLDLVHGKQGALTLYTENQEIVVGK